MQKPDLTKPSVEGLAYILRHTEEWPEGFTWDYGRLGGCALALTDSRWGLNDSYESAAALGLTSDQRWEIFFALWGQTDNPEPEDVATALEAIHVNNN